MFDFFPALKRWAKLVRASGTCDGMSALPALEPEFANAGCVPRHTAMGDSTVVQERIARTVSAAISVPPLPLRDTSECIHLSITTRSRELL